LNPLRGFFVAGTDTGVGKTQVARALLSLLRDAVPLKPIETGCEPDHPEDALALIEASRGNFDLDRVCPYRFRQPAAPLVAAEAEGKTIALDLIEELVARAAPKPVVVEAAGGLLVPIAREGTCNWPPSCSTGSRPRTIRRSRPTRAWWRS
jgi:dethiobiotin synthetase